MATGFPANTAFTNGNTLSASDLNDITGNLNLIIPQTTTTLAWQTFTPSPTGMTASLNYARYAQVGKIIIAQVSWAVSAVSGAVAFSLPVTARVQDLTVFPAHIKSGGATTFVGWAQLNATTTCAIGVLNASTTYLTRTALSSTVPGTWAAGDAITTTIWYEAA